MHYLSLVLIIVSLISFIKFSKLIFNKSGSRLANFFLAGFFFIISVYTFQGYAFQTGKLELIKWFCGWPLPIYALSPVAIFFYYTSLLKNKWVWKPSYFLLFIPFILAIIDAFIFFAQSNSEIETIIEESVLYPVNRYEKQYGLLTLKSHFLIRYFWLLFVVVFLWLKLIPFLKIKTTSKILEQTNRWAFGFLLLLSVIWLSSFILISVKCLPSSAIINEPFLNGIGLIMLLATFLMAIMPFYFPVVFYNYPSVIFKKTPISSNDELIQLTKNVLEEDNIDNKIKFGLDIEAFKDRLLDFEKYKLYLTSDFDINTLANHLDIPVHHLSYLLNQHYGLRFANYRNNLRMKHAAQLIKEGFLLTSTIEALTIECGFTSRSAFSKTFKLVIGENPSDYSSKFQKTLPNN